MSKLLNEEIERFKLLSRYDNRKTLDENFQTEDVINEQLKSVLSNLFKLGGREAGTLSKTAVRELESLFKLFPTEMKKFGNDAAEIAAKLKSQSYTAKELGQLRTTIFKGTDDLTVRKEIADDMVKSKPWKDFFSSTKEKNVIDDLIKKGYSADDAKLLADRYIKQGGKFKESYKTGLKTKYKTTKPKKQRFSNYNYPPPPPKNRMTIMSLLKGVALIPSKLWGLLKTCLKLGLGIAAAYYIWKYFTENGSTGYPPCLGKNIPVEDFEKMVEEGREYILNTDTGNELIDSNEGGRFYQDGKFETENEKYKGTWKEDSKSGILIVLDNGDELTMSCEGMVDFELDTEEIDKFKKDFPMSVGDENLEIVGSVQRCLGLSADGVFSSELEKAMKDNNYGSVLTQSTYRRIMSDCGQAEQSSGYLSSLI
jgi:hypothetical protein